MVSRRPTRRDRTAALGRERREDWLSHSVLSGFAATFAMSVVFLGAYGLAAAIGDHGGSRLERWFDALAHNEATRGATDALLLAVAVNVCMGLVWSMVYARFAEPVLPGPGWRKGILFALVPWVLSLIVFFPLLDRDVGFLGRSLDAGPLPVLGNLILHVVYGAVLGAIYGSALEAGLDDPDAERAAARAAERGAAVGVGVGLLLGAVVGWLLGPQLWDLGSRGAVTLELAFLGAALGILVGSMVGIERGPRPA